MIVISYIKYYKNRDIVFGIFKAKYHVNKEDRSIHVQSVNELANRLNRVVNYDLKGVSTKYIQGYLNWIMFVKNTLKKKVRPIKKILGNKVALDIFKQKEKEFQYFLSNNGRSCFGECKVRWKLEF